jgi:outer membrane lipoprotein SlyB
MAAAGAKSEKKKDVGKVAITTGAGAIIGAIAGGGKGAAIGAAVGGAGGTAVVMGTRGGPAVIAAGSELHFKVKTPVEITEKK